MWCAFHKWRISQSLDSGKPPAGLTRRHLEKCSPCREYAGFAEDLGQRLAKDAAGVLESGDSSLAQRVSTALGRRAGSPSFSRPRPIRLKPALTAAISLGVVGITVIWVFTSRPAKIPRLGPLFDLARPQVHLANAAIKAESPLQEEILEWRQALISAADYLKAKLEVKLGE